MDASVEKQFQLTEAAHLEVRVEGFNVLNGTRFGAPVAAWGSPQFGVVNSLAPGFSPRRMQLVARIEF